ncbi:MAG TPA: HAMP domain-containing sensor histidine kinase [Solirubrobacterales bacterium]|nr:HAMP domain-containing sensor histidine kinase [Solirubrobacterales bacterium]
MAGTDHLEQILDNVPSGLISLDASANVVYRNRSAARLAPQLEPGINIWDALAPVINEEKIDLVLRGERVLFKMGPGLPLLEWLMSDSRPDDGTRILMAWPAEITDEIIQGRTTFIIGASHELRSPLTALLGFAELLELQGESLSPEQAEAVGVIRRNAEHLDSMVDDIIDLSKNSFGELRLDIENLDIPEIVVGVTETLRPQIEAKGQVLSIDAEAGTAPIQADRHRVRQIVFNLLQNAHRHTPAGTNIRVSVETDRSGFRIAVEDDGDGLPFEDAEEAFSSFRRGPLDHKHHDIAGSGIGLTITRRVVELHRGTIEVETEPGIGTAFIVWLPGDREKARELVLPQ